MKLVKRHGGESLCSSYCVFHSDVRNSANSPILLQIYRPSIRFHRIHYFQIFHLLIGLIRLNQLRNWNIESEKH